MAKRIADVFRLAVTGGPAANEQTRLPRVFTGLMAVASVMVASMLISLAPIASAHVLAVLQVAH